MNPDDCCIHCHAATGLTLTDDYEWICRDDVACLARMELAPPELGELSYTSPQRVAEAIDRDFERRKRRGDR